MGHTENKSHLLALISCQNLWGSLTEKIRASPTILGAAGPEPDPQGESPGDALARGHEYLLKMEYSQSVRNWVY